MKLIEKHPLGYIKVNLLSVFGYRARLHIWRTDTIEDAHNHRWNFLSIPLWGRFVDRYYMEVPLEYAGGFAKPGLERVDSYPDRGAGRRYVPRVTGGETVQPVMAHVRRPLRPWRCRRGEIHSFQPIGSGPHVSLVLLGRPEAVSSDVWRQKGVSRDDV